MTSPNRETPQTPTGLRIVLVEFLPSGGMFQFSFQLADALARAGHHVRLLTGPDPELASTHPRLEVVSALPTWHPNADPVGSPLRRRLRRVGRAFRLLESWRRVIVTLRRGEVDVAQFGELRFGLDTAAFCLLSVLGRAGCLVDVAHNPVPYDVTSAREVEKSGRLTRRLLAAAYRRCDLVLVLGEGPRADLVTTFPDVGEVAVIGHGDYSAVLDSSAVPPPSSAPAHALFFGAWTRYKNIPLMLDAFAIARQQLPTARLTLAGPVMPDVDLAEVSARAAEIGHVDLRPGYVAMADLPALFAGHRVVLFTYETVNISGSVHMAYTFGRPVVATAVGAMGDAVVDGLTGRLAPPEPAAVARALVGVLGDPDTADRLGREAHRHAAAAASWTAVARRTAAAYAGVRTPNSAPR